LNLELIDTYGLRSALTDEDDGALWEAALRAYWPQSVLQKTPLDQLSFRIGVAPDPEESKPLGSVLKSTDAWMFVREGPKAIRALPTELERKFVAPRNILEIARPSLGEELAMVHHALLAGPRTASGIVYVWKHRDGVWKELHVVTRWTS